MYLFIYLGTCYFQVVSDDKDIITRLKERWFTLPATAAHFDKKVIINIDYLLKKYSKRSKRLRDNLNISELDYCDFLVTAFIEKALVREKIFFLHGSAVVYKNKVIVFLGPSTAGKSTVLTRLEKPCVYAEDTVIIQMMENDYIVIKSVFDKKHIYTDDGKKISLKALFFLAKSKKDSIKHLSAKKYLENILHNNILVMSGLAMEKEVRRLHLANLFSLTTNIHGNTFFFKKTGHIKMNVFNVKEA